MAVGPDGPVELYNTTSRNLGHGVRATLRAGSLVADDVGSGEGVGLYKAIVEVLGIPANVLGDLTAVLLGVVVVELEALGVDTAMALREVMVLYMLTDVDGKVLRKNEVVRWKRKFDW
jgi:hypothetical protein